MSEVSKAKAGHLPTLLACFFHFDLSFMLWVMLGALGVFAAESLGLSSAQKGLMVAVPVLSGSLLRIPVGLLSDRIGARRMGVALLIGLYVPLLVGWLGATTFGSVLLLGLLLGVGGASFAVALPLASRWYPPGRQGLAMGIAAAGNSGTVLSNLLAPRLAVSVGWHGVFGLALLPVSLVLLGFLLMARERPRERTRVQFRPLLARAELRWLCLLYAVTFGGYVGLSSFMPLFLRDQYAASALAAGSLTAMAAFAGSAFRPIGGIISDRVGGARVLRVALLAVGALYLVAAQLPARAPMVALLTAGIVCLGLGNGAVFQMVPQRFSREVGAATGVIGAVGGLGGFVLPMVLGLAKQSSGSFGLGFALLAIGAFVAAFALGASALVGGGAVASQRGSA